jgi:anthranilate phosphoribosyltransferase
MPEDAGLPLSRIELLKGGDVEVNAKALLSLLDGKIGPYRDIVLLNSASALCVSGRASSLKDGVDQAMRSIDQGEAKTALNNLIKISNLS